MRTGSRSPKILAASMQMLPLVFLVLCLAGSGRAQNSNAGDIRGTVTDATGAMIPGVNVTILDVDTGVTKELTTNGAGLYDAVSILPGKYKITFSKDGFDKYVRDGITLEVGLLTVNARLTVGTAQQQIEVTAEATLLKTETGEQSTSLEADVMVLLPNVGTNWENFTKIIPGASNWNAGDGGQSIAVNGNLPFYSNFLADGGSSTLPHSANFDYSIFESMSELQVQTSSFSAQYGIGGVVFNQISKGGTNQFHGAAYEYLQNDDFNARNFFSPTVPNERYDNLGGAIGGPIRKNKLFFYFNFDKIINRSQSTNFYTYPTADMKSGNFSNTALFPIIYDPATTANGVRSPFPGNIIPASRIDAVAKNINSYFPTPTLPGISNNLLFLNPGSSPFNKEFGRLDYNVSDKNRVTFSITQRDNPATYPSPDNPVDSMSGDVDSYNAQISDVWTISPNTINEFRFAYTRQGNWFQPFTLGKGYPDKLGIDYAVGDEFPSIQIYGGVNQSYMSLGPGTEAIYIENSFQPSDVVTMIKGRHVLHFGGEVLMQQDNSTPWGSLNAATMQFNGVYTQQTPPNSATTGMGFADFLLGDVNQWSASNTPIVGSRLKSPQVFVQDDIKLRPNLTINLGLRDEVHGGWSEIDGRFGMFDPTVQNTACPAAGGGVTSCSGAIWFQGNNGRNAIEQTKNVLLPRIGFAWSPRSKWSVRGGFGIYSIPWSIDTYSGNAEGFGASSQGSSADNSGLTPLFQLSATNPALNYVQASKDPSAYNGQSPSYVPYNTPVGRTYQWTVSAQRELGGNLLAELAYVGNHGAHLAFPVDLNQVPLNEVGPGNPQPLRPYTQYNNINATLFNAISNYDSLQASLKRRFSMGLSFEVNYTWEHFLDEQDSAGWGSRGGSQPWQDALNPALNYGNSNFNVPQMFKGDVVYQLPFGKGKNLMNTGLADALFGGWQASTIFVAQSGSPYTVYAQNVLNSGAGNNFQQYANVVGNPYLSNPTIADWYNVAAFSQPANYTIGNEGRNILRGPDLRSVDFSMGKTFKFPKLENAGLTLRFDATNILNHPSFSNPGNLTFNGGNPGQITSTSVGSRVLQLGARLYF